MKRCLLTIGGLDVLGGGGIGTDMKTMEHYGFFLGVLSFFVGFLLIHWIAYPVLSKSRLFFMKWTVLLLRCS